MATISPPQTKTIVNAARKQMAAHADDVAAAALTSRVNANLNPVVRGVAGTAKAGGRVVDDAVLMELQQEAAAKQFNDRLMGRAYGVAQSAMLAPLAVGGAELVTRGAMWSGSKLVSVANKDLAASMANYAKPLGWNSVTFQQLGDATRTSGIVGGAFQKVANVMASPIQTVTSAVGLDARRAAANLTKAGKHLDAAKAAIGGLAESELTLLGGLKDAIMNAPNASALAGSGTEGLVTAAKEALKNEKNISTAAQSLLSSTENALAHTQTAAMWSNVKGAVQNAPSALGKVRITHGMVNGAFIGISALSMFGDARGFSQNLSSLKQMYADITGEDVKKVSTMKVLTGKVPDSVAAARSHLLTKFSVKQAFDVVNIGLNVAMMISPRGSGGWKGLAAMVGTQIASSTVDGMMGESILPVHKAFSDAYKSGRQIPAEFYASYLYAASKELRSRGEQGQQFAMQVAMEYANEQASPGQLLNEIENGKLIERIKNITAMADKVIAESQQNAAPAVEQKPELQKAEPVVQQQPEQQNIVARAEKPVVGKFTSKLSQEPRSVAMGTGIAG